MTGAAGLQGAILTHLGHGPDVGKITAGRFTRWGDPSRPGDDAYYCMLFPDGEGGIYGDWRTGEQATWQSRKATTPEESKAFAEQVKLANAKYKRLEEKRRAKARDLTAEIIKAAGPLPAPADNPYLLLKHEAPVTTLRELHIDQVTEILGYHPESRCVKLSGRILLAPVKIGDQFTTIEMIDESGRKSAIAGGAKKGGYWAAQPLPAGDGNGLNLLIAEGIATALTGKRATGFMAIAALSCGNLQAVAVLMRERYPKARILIIADLGNGQAHAEAAARSTGSILIIPQFKTIGSTGTDINDLAIEEGIDSVKRIFMATLASTTDTTETAAAPVLPAILTDMRNGETFAAVYGDRVKYCCGWWIFDGCRWIEDHRGTVDDLLRKLIKNSYLEAVGNHDRIKALLGLESHAKQTAILASAAVTTGIIMSNEDFDSDVMALNVMNGTISLKTGIIRPHRAADLFTKMVNIHYDPSATCPTWERFLSKVLGGDASLISYVQRFIGYCLTGRTDEQVLLFLYGQGSNGKTTFLNVLSALLGDYATTASAELIMQRTGGDLTILSTMAALEGKRLVAISELDEGERIAEARVKSLTGSDRRFCRKLYHGPFSYLPTDKFILAGNHKPTIRGTDLGIWRRFHLLPFTVTITEAEKDPSLPIKLTEELPGILAWAVQGCLEWQRQGLAAPDIIRAAVTEYRKSEDVFQGWIDDSCIISSHVSASASELLTSFVGYSGFKNYSHVKLAKSLKERGFSSSHNSKGYKMWDGIGIKTEGTEGYTPFSTFYAEKNKAQNSGKTPINPQNPQGFDLSNLDPDGTWGRA